MKDSVFDKTANDPYLSNNKYTRLKINVGCDYLCFIPLPISDKHLKIYIVYVVLGSMEKNVVLVSLWIEQLENVKVVRIWTKSNYQQKLAYNIVKKYSDFRNPIH